MRAVAARAGRRTGARKVHEQKTRESRLHGVEVAKGRRVLRQQSPVSAVLYRQAQALGTLKHVTLGGAGCWQGLSHV